ncbi:MAG: glycosyltransferase family 9 protein [Rhodospirillales bacterium]|nr:glycosyltransferase family 9 protein [Rhodospirillales bacterium]
MRILFITSTRVGDAILSTGLLDHLIRQHPGAKITVACGGAAASVFEAVPGLERIIVLDKMAFSLHWLRLWGLCIGRIWDVVVDLRNSPMYFVLPARKRWRIGRAQRVEHRVRQLAAILDLADTPPAPHLWLTEGIKARARGLVGEGARVIAVGPTANWRAKTWRAENFVELIERLTGPSGIIPGGRVAIFGRDDERPSALSLIEAVPAERRIDLVGHLDLLEAFACLKCCDFYIGNDSGLMHLAAASGIPTLGLFGPSPKELYAPWGDFCDVAATRVPYEEIFPPNFDHRGSDTLMDSLTVDDAEQAARGLWNRAQAEGGT